MTNQCKFTPVTTKILTPRRALALAAACFTLGALGVSHARAQADLTFTGGLGTPLALTLNAPVTYVVTTAGGEDSAPLFDFQSVGNLFSSRPGMNGTITFTVNSGTAQTLTTLNSGIGAGSLAATDAYLYGEFPGVAVGDTVVLNAGTLTTNGNFAGAPPAGGSYQTFLFDDEGIRLSAGNGIAGAAPEPSTWAAVLGGVGVLGIVLHRRAARM